MGNRMAFRTSYSLLTTLVLLAGCVGNEPRFSTTPEIEFVSIEPKVIKEYATTFYVKLRYKDGDGNLGYEDEFSTLRDSADLIMFDNRPGVAALPEYDGRWTYNLPNLTPSGKNPSIQGEITVEFPALMARLDPLNTEEKLTFTIWIYDRDGNRSNSVVTDEVTVVP
ncbi:MAG: hypothetical protein KF690_02285 [Bacteroidetes bacterium]|nr:hypothetical protein [Bacteroidota bacterium]